MNLNDKNIDQIFRDAAQNSAAPRYDRAFWKEMNSTLDAHDKRKRGFLLWSLAGSFVSAILVFALFLVNGTKSDLLLTDSNNYSENTVNNSGKYYPTNENASLNSDTDNSIQTEELRGTKDVNSESNQANYITENSPLARNAKSSNLNSNVVDEGVSQEKLNNNSTEMTTQNTKNTKTSEESTFENQNITIAEEINTLSVKNIQLYDNKILDKLMPFSKSNSNSINYFAKISLGLMENYETSRPFQSGVSDISMNIEYEKDQVLLRTGLGFQMTSNADLVVSERAKVYGFGVTTHQNNLSYQSLYDIYVPIELGYTLNNTSFGVGTQLNYLVYTTMNLESLENNLVVNNHKLNGLSDGLNSITTQGYVWLEQSLSKRFAAGIKIGTNLSSRIKEGRFFNESSTTNPLYGQITLKYNLKNE